MTRSDLDICKLWEYTYSAQQIAIYFILILIMLRLREVYRNKRDDRRGS